MNLSIIRRWLGYVLMLEGALMLLPCIVALVYGEKEGMTFLIVAAGAFALGVITALPKPRNTVFYLKEGCVATALSWIVLSLVGCLPFFITGIIPSFVDALFETVSGFTTTGASILNEVESLPRSILFWRSFTHWIGGMGILVFIMAILPMSAGNGSSINLLRAESPGPSVGKLMPKMRHTAGALYGIYVGLSVLMLVFLMLGGFNLVDAMMVMFGTAGTGGFGIKNDSIASYSPYIQWVIIVFMAMFGVNFSAYFMILTKRFKRAFSIEEVRWYFGIISISIIIIFLNIYKISDSGFKAFTDSAFQVVSIITTTGFTTADYDQWSQLSKVVILMIMFTGACAGSTGGGVKVSRIMIMIKTYLKELMSYIHPKSVKKIKIDGKVVEDDVVRSTNVFFITVLIVFLSSLFVVSLDNQDMVSSFSAVLTTLSNVGPGLGKNGPSLNFAFYSDRAKLVLIFDMLAGRLEYFPLLVMLSPRLWVENGRQKLASYRTKKIQK